MRILLYCTSLQVFRVREKETFFQWMSKNKMCLGSYVKRIEIFVLLLKYLKESGP